MSYKYASHSLDLPEDSDRKKKWLLKCLATKQEPPFSGNINSSQTKRECAHSIKCRKECLFSSKQLPSKEFLKRTVKHTVGVWTKKLQEVMYNYNFISDCMIGGNCQESAKGPNLGRHIDVIDNEHLKGHIYWSRTRNNIHKILNNKHDSTG